MRGFVIGNSDPPNRPALARDLHAYLAGATATADTPALEAQRRERARVRSERQYRWGRLHHTAA